MYSYININTKPEISNLCAPDVDGDLYFFIALHFTPFIFILYFVLCFYCATLLATYGSTVGLFLKK